MEAIKAASHRLVVRRVILWLTTVRSYGREYADAQRRVAALQAHEVEAIRAGVRRGARARWERTYGEAVVAHAL